MQTNTFKTLLTNKMQLLPLDVAAFWLPDPSLRVPDGTLIIFHDSDAWYANPAFRRFLAHSERMWGDDEIMRGSFDPVPAIVVFRYRHGR